MTLIIEFGSKHHGCLDRYSDRDLMLFYDNPSSIRRKKEYYEKKGYSVSICSINSARYQASKGSLFLRHVAFEGSLVQGDSGVLDSITKRWTAASSYDQEIESNIELLSTLGHVPNNMYGNCVVNDILICSIRNVLIRKLANDGCYAFSWRDIMEEALNRGWLGPEDIEPLLLARRFKNAYRNQMLPNISDALIERLESISRSMIDPMRTISRKGRRPRVTTADSYRDGSYSQLRAIELLCAHYQFDSSVHRLRLATSDPSYFAAVGPNKAINRDAA